MEMDASARNPGIVRGSRSARVPRAGSGRLWRPVLLEARRFLTRTRDAWRYDPDDLRWYGPNALPAIGPDAAHGIERRQFAVALPGLMPYIAAVPTTSANDDPLPGPAPGEPSPPARRRRPRYAGKHPRAFHEKYKELNPERYAGEVQKILASGKTPAGMHRPIMVQEILDALAPRPGEIAVDATLGYGGHAAALLERLVPGGRLIGLDADPVELPRTEDRLRAQGFGSESFSAHRTNFAGLPQILAGEGVREVDLVLADLGVSSMQLDDPNRGFTCKESGPLDMRMNPARGPSAAEFLRRVTEEDLRRLLAENSDEPFAPEIAAALARQPVATTEDLRRVVREAVRSRRSHLAKPEIDDSVRRTFQAVRIAVNDEFSALETFLRHLPWCVRSGGRIAILTFHSGEDRRVKKAFQSGHREGVYAVISDTVRRATPEEIRANPRASSAKLRWAVRA
jgi:16S rRNA (cytosine1402-N4)-methyltransferase